MLEIGDGFKIVHRYLIYAVSWSVLKLLYRHNAGVCLYLISIELNKCFWALTDCESQSYGIHIFGGGHFAKRIKCSVKVDNFRDKVLVSINVQLISVSCQVLACTVFIHETLILVILSSTCIDLDHQDCVNTVRWLLYCEVLIQWNAKFFLQGVANKVLLQLLPQFWPMVSSTFFGF